jgi:predicted permease
MLLGFSLKQISLFRTEDRAVLGNVILYITLPAMLISSFNGVRLDYWFVISFLLSRSTPTY